MFNLSFKNVSQYYYCYCIIFFQKTKNLNYSKLLTGSGNSKGMFLICKCDMYIYGIM